MEGIKAVYSEDIGSWVLEGSTYHVKERIKNEYGGTWSVPYSVWMLKGKTEEEATSIAQELTKHDLERREKKRKNLSEAMKARHAVKKQINEENKRMEAVCLKRMEKWKEWHEREKTPAFYTAFVDEKGICNRCKKNIFIRLDPDVEPLREICDCPFCGRSFLD